MKAATLLKTAVLSFAISSTALANTYGSVEPIANSREALTKSGSVHTINGLNIHFEVGAGGFFGNTNPAYVYTVIDSGPNAASNDDIKILTDSLGYVLSQGSAFLLDADDTMSFDFPANYVVLNFDAPPSLERSAALFETVGRIDPELFETDSSGYSQYGRAYASLQSFVPDAQFIAGYVQAAAEFGVEYTPIVGGAPSLFQGAPGSRATTGPRAQTARSTWPGSRWRATRRWPGSGTPTSASRARRCERSMMATTMRAASAGFAGS